jgi:hypothetical protein
MWVVPQIYYLCCCGMYLVLADAVKCNPLRKSAGTVGARGSMSGAVGG